MRAVRLPRYTAGSLEDYLNILVGELERAINQSPSGRPYSVTNAPATRVLNASTATASDVAKVLGTLIGDLKAGSVVG